MRLLVFGNPLAKIDSAAVKVAKKLDGKLPGVSFVRFDTAEDLEADCPRLLILDVVVGLKKPRLVGLSELELAAKPLSLHGFDLTWNLLLLKRLGRLKEATIIGVPPKMPVRESLPAVEGLIKKIARENGSP